MSDSEDSQTSRKQQDHSDRPPLSPAWKKQASQASANSRDRKPSGSARKGPSKLPSPVAPSTGASTPHPFARNITGDDFLVYAPSSAHIGATSSSSTEDQEPHFFSLATSTSSGKRPLDELRSRTDTPMTIATLDSTSSLPGASYSYTSHDVTFVYPPHIVSRLRAQGIPDFLIRHYALLTVTMHRSAFPTTTLRFSPDMPFALFASYAMICGSSDLRDAYMHVLDMGSGVRDPKHLRLVGDHVNTMLSTLEDMKRQFSPDILCGLHAYVGHFRAYLDDPVSFPLQHGASLPFSRLGRILSRNISLQTIHAFFLALETPISFAMEFEDQFHLLPTSIDSDFSTNVMVSNTPPFSPIGSTVYDYSNLGFRPLLLLHVDRRMSLIRPEDVLPLFLDHINLTLADSQVYSTSMPPPPSYRELFQHTLDNLPADPVVFSHDYILQALHTSLTDISASAILTAEDMHSLASHILSVRISTELSQHTHPASSTFPSIQDFCLSPYFCVGGSSSQSRSNLHQYTSASGWSGWGPSC